MKLSTRLFVGLFSLSLLSPLLCMPNGVHLPEPNEIASDLYSPPPTPPSQGHWLGTDDRGRDVLSRLLFGTRNSLLLCGSACLLILFWGYVVGLLLGFMGSKWDLGFQRLIEIWGLLPAHHIALLFMTILPSAISLLCVWVLFGWVSLSQYVRLEVLKSKASGYVISAKALGASSTRIIFKEILPNSLSPLTTFAPQILGNLLVSLASLDYLGLGLPPPMASLGELLHEAQDNLQAWWLLVFPLLMLFLLVASLHFMGQSFSQRSDTRSSKILGNFFGLKRPRRQIDLLASF